MEDAGYERLSATVCSIKCARDMDIERGTKKNHSTFVGEATGDTVEEHEKSERFEGE